jgi:hypothetical protein
MARVLIAVAAAFLGGLAAHPASIVVSQVLLLPLRALLRSEGVPFDSSDDDVLHPNEVSMQAVATGLAVALGIFGVVAFAGVSLPEAGGPMWGVALSGALAGGCLTVGLTWTVYPFSTYPVALLGTVLGALVAGTVATMT